MIKYEQTRNTHLIHWKKRNFVECWNSCNHSFPTADLQCSV